MRQQFKTTDVLRLEVERETAPGEPLNLVENANGALGGWGWLTPVSSQKLRRAPAYLGPRFEFKMGGSAAAYFTTENLPVTAGKYVAARWTNSSGTPSTQGYRLRFEFYNASDVLVSSGPQNTFRTTTGLGSPIVLVPAALVPATAVSVRLRCDFYKDVTQANPVSSSYMRFHQVVVVEDTVAPDPALIDPDLASAYYTNILGSSNDITIERSELDAGILRATICDPTLDPSQNTLVRPGHKVRLRALIDVDTWDDVSTGQVTNGRATYDPAHPNPNKRARTTLASVDAAASLGQSRPAGVDTIDALPYVLEGCGVPWNCNGSGGQVAYGTAVAINDAASALDQVVLTRDSVLGYAWVDRAGVLQAWDRATIPTDVAAVLDEDVYTSDIVIDYDTDRCINSVTVTFLRYDATTGETTEVTYGPYRDDDSIRVWGVHAAEFKIQWAIEDEPAIEALAAAILTANATPQVRVTEVTIALDTTAKVAAHATRDLYDLVTVSNTNAGISESYRVTSIKHTITPSKWLLTLGFAVEGGVASPTFVPAPGGGVAGLTFAQLLQPIGHVEMFYGDLADVTPGWLALVGGTFSAATYPRLYDHLGTNVLPDFTDRFPIGAGSKALGTSGGNPTKVITAANLPPHSHDIPTRASSGLGTAAPAEGSVAGSASTKTTGNGPGTSTPLDVMNPWRALWFIIRAV